MYIFPSGYQINEQNEEGQTAEKITNWILKQQHDHSDVASFDSSIAESIPESINAFVLVCAHMKRDKKCGIAGPMLIEAFWRIENLANRFQFLEYHILGGINLLVMLSSTQGMAKIRDGFQIGMVE